MKKILVLLVLAVVLLSTGESTGATYDYRLVFSTGTDLIDSVRCSCYVANTQLTDAASTVKVTSFPSGNVFVTIPDTANVKIDCRWHFTGETGYRRSSEIVPANDTGDFKLMIRNNWNLDAMQAQLGISGMEKDSTCVVRYFSLSGNNTDGKTWATAFSTLANLNAFWRNLSLSSNYDGMNKVYVSADSFNFADAALCTLYADNTWLIGAGDYARGRPASIWYKMVVQGDADTVGDDRDLIRIFGDNCHILNMTLCAFDTVGDPDPGGLTGGNNAITFDTVTGGIQGGEVAYCYFPSPNHKPLQMHSHGTTKVAKNLWFHHNIFDHPQRHGIDAWMENGIIEDNIFISHATGDVQGGIEGGAIQLLGTGAANAKGNVIRRNTFHFSATGIKLLNSDSNIVVDNVFNRPQIPWTVSFNGNYRNNMIVGNKINIDTDVPFINGGLIGNPSFENWKGDKYTPLDWGAQNGTVGNGGRSEVHWEDPRSGGWAYNLKGTTSGTPTAAYLDTKLWHLSLGKLVWSGWMRGDPVAPTYDTLGVTLFMDKVAGDSTVFTWTIPEVDTLNYNKIGQSIRINSEGDYYLRFSAPPGAGSSPEVFIDDMDAFFYADTLVAAGGNPAGGWIDSVRSGTGAAVFNYFATDTSGADVSIEGATIRAFNKAGSIVARGKTGGTGKARMNFNPNDTIIFQVYGPLGYIWTPDDTVFGIVNNASDTNKGYNYVAAAPVAGQSATVTLWVRDNDQLPQAGIRVEASLRQSNVIDSSGSPVVNIIQIDTTDVDGKVTFTCVWSSYLIPATDWQFKIYLPSPALPVTRLETIPRVTTHTVDFR